MRVARACVRERACAQTASARRRRRRRAEAHQAARARDSSSRRRTREREQASGEDAAVVLQPRPISADGTVDDATSTESAGAGVRRGGDRGGAAVRVRAGRDRRQARADPASSTATSSCCKRRGADHGDLRRHRAQPQRPSSRSPGVDASRSTAARPRSPTPTAASRSPTSRPASTRSRCRAPSSRRCAPRRRSRPASSSRPIYDVAAGRARPTRRGQATTSRSSSSRRRCAGRSSSTQVVGRRRRARSPARRATCSRWSRTCPASRAPPPARAQLVVWGAAPEDTRVYVDGVRVPPLYHDGGLRSVISSDLRRARSSWCRAATARAYGRGLGGLVTVDARARSRATAPHGSRGRRPARRRGVAARHADAAAAGRRSAARGSYLDRSFGLVSDRGRRATSSPSRATTTGRRRAALPARRATRASS